MFQPSAKSEFHNFSQSEFVLLLLLINQKQIINSFNSNQQLTQTQKYQRQFIAFEFNPSNSLSYQMGQQHSYETGINCELVLLQQLPIGKIYKQSSSETLHFIKEYAYTSEQAFQQAFLKFSAKLTVKNDNVLSLRKTNTKVDNTFCSTFYKIVLIFEYVNYSLSDQILVRNKENRVFEEKQIWSILFHCTLGISHLKRTQGAEHSAIGLKDIKLSQDGIIKILPTEMVGISSEHDLNEGTTKKLAMTILSCILMKQISNQSSEYLQALIDKTKCSKELKKVLYFMVMDDTTFKELEEYLFKLASDENDTLLSGVSTPVYSTHKKTIQDSNVKKASHEPSKEIYLHSLKAQKQDAPNILPQFETFEIENPDETDQKQKMQILTTEENTIVQSLNEPTAVTKNISGPITVTQNISEPPSFSNENPNVNFKLKDYSVSYDDVTVRMIGKKNPDLGPFSNSYIQEAQQKQNNLYTDPKLLDLIKKDLEEIQQKSRISYSAMMKQSSANFNMINATNLTQIKEQKEPAFEAGERFKKNNSIYTMSPADFNIKPVGIETQPIKGAQKTFKSQFQNPQGVSKPTENKKIQQPSAKSELMFKQIENVPKRTKQQQCFGNILDEDAGFRKAKSKKSTTNTVTVRESEKQIRKDLQKENHQESTETKRINQSYQKPSQFNGASSIQQNKTKNSSQNKLTPQQVSKTTTLTQSESSGLEFVTQTYQKGEYKGYKLNGLRHAHGTFYYREGGKYVGEWKQNKMNGKGTLYYPNNEIAYEGNWKDDQLHGYGTLYNQQVTKLQKSFDYQDWSMVEQYWVKYQGEFCMDNKHGKGKLFLSNGEVFEGNFKEDMVDGQGVLGRDNGSRVRGIWRKNKLLRMY